MTPTECAEFLRQHNAWRRGGDGQQTDPVKLGIALDAAVAHLEAMGWRPIETAPKDGTVFLGWVSAERWSAADGGGSGIGHDVSQVDFCWWCAVSESPYGGFFDSGSGQIGDEQDVTHWMPLPATPSNAEVSGAGTASAGLPGCTSAAMEEK